MDKLPFPPTLDQLIEAYNKLDRQYPCEIRIVRGTWFSQWNSPIPTEEVVDMRPMCLCPLSVILKANGFATNETAAAEGFGVEMDRIDDFIEGVDYFYDYEVRSPLHWSNNDPRFSRPKKIAEVPSNDTVSGAALFYDWCVYLEQKKEEADAKDLGQRS